GEEDRVGAALLPGAALPSLRDLLYFGSAAITPPLLVLAAWATAGTLAPDPGVTPPSAQQLGCMTALSKPITGRKRSPRLARCRHNASRPGSARNGVSAAAAAS